MYCPNCTAEISTEHRYCRGCGVDLREISQALGGDKHVDRRPLEEPQPERRVNSRSLTVWGRGFYSGILGLAFVFFGAWLSQGMLVGVGMVLIICAIILMVSSYFIRDRPPKRGQSPTSTTEFSAETSVPSVTESTTKLFEGEGPEESRSGVKRSGSM